MATSREMNRTKNSYGSIGYASDPTSLLTMPQSEDDEPDFVPPVDEKHRCCVPSCKRVLRNAMQTGCGHRLCEECLNALINENPGQPPLCPAGEEDCEQIIATGPGKNVHPDKYARREVNNLRVYCPYRMNGCPVDSPWAKMNREHIGVCEYESAECPYQSYGCSEDITKKSLNDHERGCQYKPLTCQYCQSSVAQCRLGVHLENECLQVTRPCPYKCGEQALTLEQRDEHVPVCPARPKECHYKHYGCQFQGSESELKKHEDSSSNSHLYDVALKVAELELENTKLKSVIQEKTNRLDILYNECQDFREEASKQSDIASRAEKRCRDLSKITANLSEKVIRLETQVQEQMSGQQETLRTYDDRLVLVENNTVTGPAASNRVQTKMDSLDRLVSMHDIRLAELDLHCQMIESTSLDGVLLWKINDFSRRLEEAVSNRTVSLYSQPFYTSRYGYKMCARIYLNGDGMGKGTHLSLFFVIMKGDYDNLIMWPFRQKVSFYLMDQQGHRDNITDSFRPDPASSSFQKPRNEMNIASGCPMFASLNIVRAGQKYLRDDAIFIKVVVDKTNLYDPSL